MIEYNLEEGLQTVVDAMSNLKSIIDRHRNCKETIVFIHGYGSSGKGCAICKNARQWLSAQVRNGKIKAAIFGEDFDLFDAKAREIKQFDAETQKMVKEIMALRW